MRSPAIGSLVLTLLMVPAALVAQSGGLSATVVATATIAPRASLQVSTRVLEFQIAEGSDEGLAIVEFTTAARAIPGADVLLTVETEAGLTGPGGAADLEADITFSGDLQGMLAGVVSRTEPVTAARWSGGGVRRGRLVFKLRASAPGAYTLPVKFAISVP